MSIESFNGYTFDEDGFMRLIKQVSWLTDHLDSGNIDSIHTNKVVLADSSDGYTEIDHTLIRMYDSSGTLRLMAGWDSSNVAPTTASNNFVFNLYDSLGSPTIQLDSCGKATFSGNIQTQEDAYVGRHLIIGSSIQPLTLSTNASGLHITYPGTTNVMLHLKTTDYNPGGTTQLIISFASSEVIMQYSIRTMILAQIGYSTGGSTVRNSSDYFYIHSENDRMFINTSGYVNATTENRKTVGTFIGGAEKETFLTPWGYSTNRVATEGFVKHRDIENDLRYFCGKNTKTIFSSSARGLVASSTTLSNTTNSTNGIIQLLPAKIKSIINTTGQFIMAGQTITSLNLLTFNDGTVATSDDWLVFIFHIDSTTITSTSWGVFTQIGQDASTCFTYKYGSTHGYNFSTGFNVISRRMGSYSTVSGSPVFTDIRYIRFGFMTADTLSTGLGICPDYLGMHRNLATASTWNDFQVLKNSTYEVPYTVNEDKFMVFNYTTEICLADIKSIGGVHSLGIDNKLYSCFEANIKGICNKDGRTGAFRWAHMDGASNNITLYCHGSTMILEVTVNSTMTQYTVAMATLSYGNRYNINVTRDYDGYVKATFQVTDNFGSIRSLYVTTPFKSTDFGYLWWGSANSTAHNIVTSIQYSHYNG